MSRFILTFVCVLAAVLNAQVAGSPRPSSPWSLTSSYTVRETVDGNVFLQDIGEKAHSRSMVTSATPGIALGYQRTAAFKAAFSYAPEIVRYHSYSSENNVAHRAGVNLNGSSGRTSWELTNALVRIDGSDQGPIFDVANKCDIPAIGGIPLRERRDAIVIRNGFKLTQTMGRWFLRPVFSSYYHDFRTEQRVRTGSFAGYENYVDRYEINGGVDLGHALGEKTWVVVGHRYGRSHQGELLGVRSAYSSSYNRVLVGLEGAPVSWLRLNLQAGPDIRRFPMRPAGFDPDEMLWFVNGSVIWLPAKQDSITATTTRYQQPAFSSQSVYEDIVYDLAWKHQYGRRLSTTAGFRIYGGDWQAPANREDWIHTPSASITYTLHKYVAAEVAYSHDSVESMVPNTAGREYTRGLFSFSIKGSF